jgi:hypothetical protein
MDLLILLISISMNIGISILSRDQESQRNQHNPVPTIKEGCHMIISCIISKFPKFDGFTINIGPIGLNFIAGGSC